MISARAVIVQDQTLALIERQRDGLLYYVVPGGGVEKGETPDQAVIREVREELGLVVRQERLIALIQDRLRLHHVFLVTVIGGVFGTGDGDEMRGARPPERGSYRPVWLPIDDLACQTVYPAAVVDLVLAARTGGWPASPRTIVDDRP